MARKRRRGFTIIETMVAATVMAFVLTTSITTMQRAFTLLSSAHTITAGNRIIRHEFEKLRMQTFSEVAALPKRETLVVDPTFTSNPKIAGRFTLVREVSKVRGNDDLVCIEITISWQSFGRTLSRSSTTYYARYGAYDYVFNT